MVLPRLAKVATVLRALRTETEVEGRKVEDYGLRQAMEKLYSAAQDFRCSVIDCLKRTFPVNL